MPWQECNRMDERLRFVARLLDGDKMAAVCREFVMLCRKLNMFTDPDARSMATSGLGSGMVGYNTQASVDTKHHLIVVHEVTNEGHDRHQLYNMAQQTKEAIGTDTLDVVADRGYFTGTEILACEESNITTYLPRPQTSGSTKKGMFSKRDFIYKAETNEYECPAGERLTWRFETEEKGLKIHKYWSSSCPSCSIRSQCTSSTNRRVGRWEHEAVVDAVEARLDSEPHRMRVRRETAEHPFGTIKSWMGYTHFQMKTLKHVSTEMSLHVLAYNLKRMINIMGVRRHGKPRIFVCNMLILRLITFAYEAHSISCLFPPFSRPGADVINSQAAVKMPLILRDSLYSY